MADAAARKDLAWNNQWATVGQQALSPSPPLSPGQAGAWAHRGGLELKSRTRRASRSLNVTLSLMGLRRVGGRPTLPPFCTPGPDSGLVLTLPRG